MNMEFVQTVVSDGWSAGPRESHADLASMSLWRWVSLPPASVLRAQQRRLPVT
jgi:hypothetical protein